MAKELRYYQQEAIDTIHKKLKQSITKQILVLATGAGKTFTAVKAINVPEFKKKLWITHSEELLMQSGAAFLSELYPEININAMIETYGGLTEYVRYVKQNPLFSDTPEAQIAKSINIIKADLFGLDGEITLASAQTLYRRLDRISQNYFDVIVADECHLFASKTFSMSLNYFQPKLLLGLTATPHRNDGALLSDIFDEIVYQYNIGDAIVDGYLCELDAIRIKTNLDLDKVRTTGGEFNQGDLSNAVDTPERNSLIVQKYQQYASGKQNIVFCVDREHAVNMHKAFIDAGETAEILVGDENITEDRQGTIRRFKRGDITHLINVNIAIAGFDHPNVQCVTMARPTKSKTLFIQAVGRGSRTLGGVIDGIDDPLLRKSAISNSNKTKCIILDVVDTTSRHKLINTWELDRAKDIKDQIFTTAETKKKLTDERQRKMVKVENQHDQDKRVSLLDLPNVKLGRGAWTKDMASEKQIALLARLGYPTNDVTYTKGQANELISNAPATDAQVYALRKFNYDTSKGVTRGEADLAFKEIEAKVEKQKQAKITSEIYNVNLNDEPPIIDLF